MIMKKRLACCTNKEVSLDFDEQNRIVTYNGLETLIDSQSYDNDSGNSRETSSIDEDASSSSSSNKTFGSFSSHSTTVVPTKKDEWELSSPQYVKEKTALEAHFPDIVVMDTMKEMFSKLLLGEDFTGGAKGVSTALALSKGITSLAASVFGELWKLEPLSEERKSRWRREMDWMLSPTNYMVELVPAKQNGSDGQIMEVMTPKVRSDIYMNLPALQKLDSMLIGILDSMVDTEFWYAEVGSRAEGRSWNGGQSKRWWLPYPRVPTHGLSDSERTKLLNKGKVVHQVFKAVKSINENVLLEMPVPSVIKDALPKSAKASLGEELYKTLASNAFTSEEAIRSLRLKSEHSALEAINRLETAAFAWKEKIIEETSRKSPVRTSWSFVKDSMSEIDKMEDLLQRAETTMQQIKAEYPNLPQSFLEVIKVQYGTDVGHSILEAYSRVLGNLAFSILSRIGDILQEDSFTNPNSPAVEYRFPGITESPKLNRIKHSLTDRTNKVGRNDGADDEELSDEHRMSSVMATPSRSRVWCIGKEACSSVSASNSP